MIFLFMPGGPSQVDTFDPKPRLTRDHGKPSPKLYLGQTRKLLASPWKFRKQGESGLEVSELFPHVGACVDQLCVIRSMVGDDVNHPGRLPADEHGRAGGHAAEPGRLGDLRPGHREPEPARLHRHRPGAADRRRAGSTAPRFLPAAYQGTFVSDLKNPIRNLKNAQVGPDRQRRELDALRRLNELHRDSRPRRQPAERPDRVVRAGLSDADAGPRRLRPDRARPRRPGGSTASTRRRPTSSAVSVCWRGGWWSEACGSCSSTTRPAASSRGTSTAT